MIAAAKNSSKFIVNFPFICSGNSHRHANPLLSYPPIPCSHASGIQVAVSLVKVMLFISISFDEVCCNI